MSQCQQNQTNDPNNCDMDVDHLANKSEKEKNASNEQCLSLDSEDNSLPFNKIVSLQIGERKFITTIETLTQHNNQNYFGKLFSGNFSQNATFNGSYFIDRNGDIFEYVLEYLRTNTLILSDCNNTILLRKILSEAQFYMIQPLIQKITKTLTQKSWLSSDIISVHEQNKMKELFNDEDMDMIWELKHRTHSTIQPNYTAEEYKETIILIQDTAGNAFGIKSDSGIGAYSEYYPPKSSGCGLSRAHKDQNFVYFNIRDATNKMAPFQVLATGNELMTEFQSHTRRMALGCGYKMSSFSTEKITFLQIPHFIKDIATRVIDIELTSFKLNTDSKIVYSPFIVAKKEVFEITDECKESDDEDESDANE